MLFPVALVIALSALPPGELMMADRSHHWAPSRSLVQWLERRILVPPTMGGPLANFDRYYVGLYRGGRRVVFVKMVNVTTRPPGSSTVYVSKPSSVPALADFG